MAYTSLQHWIFKHHNFYLWSFYNYNNVWNNPFIDKRYIGDLNLALLEYMLNILSTSNTSSSFSNTVGEVRFLWVLNYCFKLHLGLHKMHFIWFMCLKLLIMGYRLKWKINLLLRFLRRWLIFICQHSEFMGLKYHNSKYIICLI